MPYTVVLVDSHKILRDGIRAILEQSTDFRVIGEADNGSDGVSLARKLTPHLVLMDVGLPGINGIEATTEVIRHCPATRVVILATYNEENSVVAAFRSGARGFLLKKASGTDLLDALRTVANGGSYLSSQVSDHLLTRIQRGDLESAAPAGPTAKLSPRELQVLRLVAEGNTSKDIAKILDLELLTIRTYRKTLMKKIGVINVAGLTQVAQAAGLTTWGKTEPQEKT